MNNLPIKLNWKYKQPSLLGLYFVAVKYGEGAGVYDFLEWDGKKWNTNYAGEVVAYVDLQDFKNSLEVEWPGADSGARGKQKSKKISSDDSEPWSPMPE